MEVGWCLYNLDSDKLLLDWIKFSKKSSKFEKGKCQLSEIRKGKRQICEIRKVKYQICEIRKGEGQML